MTEGLTRALTIGSAIGSGVAGGVFFAFSTFIMRALDRLPPEQGLAAMQSINREAPNPIFMAVLFGTALGCVALCVSSLQNLDEPGAWGRLIGGALYLVAILLTVVYHVPRNNSLASLGASDPGAAKVWAGYVSNWTAWNHVRTLTPIAASATLVLSLRRG